MEKEDKQFIYYWYKEFGWKANPFEHRFLYPVSKFIVGYEKERRKLNYFVIDKLPLLIINGKDGYGKTTLLLWLKEELNNYKGVVIVDYVTKEINFAKFINTLLEPVLTVKEKFIGFGSKISSKALNLIKDKNLLSIYEALYFRKMELDLGKIRDFLHSRLNERPLVLIVDDFNSLDEKLILLLKILLESHINVQVAIASEESLDKIGKKDAMKINLEGLNENECINMISKRILSVGGDSISPFTEDLLKILYKKSKSSPLIFLDLCKEKAVNIALNNLNIKKEVFEKKTENINKTEGAENKTQDEKKKESSERPYEVKVIGPKSEKAYNIIVQGKPKASYVPKKVQKDKTKAEKIK